MTAWPAGRGPEALCVRSARVVVDELVERLRLRVRVLHKPQVLEQHDLAADDGARRSAGAVDEGLEQQVAHELLGDEVTVARLADVHRVQALGHLVRAVERRRAAALVAGSETMAPSWPSPPSPLAGGARAMWLDECHLLSTAAWPAHPGSVAATTTARFQTTVATQTASV
ncbi:unnamed protein product [Miscanthus lutarioriparius]|uniref:Uncharacterized protein n=1 Tax=Miscanthus lutarioriparius TaxID=422564 RepID=A0A811RJ13_9POAL|nr:unnamed protein product [Miscanthus lutarioriparius]